MQEQALKLVTLWRYQTGLLC